MDIIIYIYLILAVFLIISVFIGYVIEEYLPETHPIMKWWRKHVVGVEQQEPKDDIYE